MYKIESNLYSYRLNIKMPRYYIAVPRKIEKFSYQTIFSWTNYSFIGTYDEAIIKAIELFKEEGYFENIYDDIYHYYGDLGPPITDFNVSVNLLFDDYWKDEKYYDLFKLIPGYFKNYFQFEADDYNKGVIEWDKFDNEYMKNWDEDKVCVIELN